MIFYEITSINRPSANFPHFSHVGLGTQFKDAYRDIGVLWRKTTGRIRDFKLFSQQLEIFLKKQCSVDFK